MKYFSKKNLMFLAVFILFLFFVFFRPRIFEGFSSDYQYLAPITGTWSQATQTAYTNYINGKNARPLSYAMQMATEDEAKQYISTGLWPYDTAVINLYNESVKNGTNSGPITNVQKMWPNRGLYGLLFNGSETNPNWNLSLSPTGIMNGMKGLGFDIGNNQQIQCRGQKSLGIVDTSNNAWTDSTDYSLFEKITGFKFNSSPCNACDVNNFCDFTYNNVSYPESYYIFKGISQPSKLTPASLSDLSSTKSLTDLTSSNSSSSYDNCVATCKKNNQ